VPLTCNAADLRLVAKPPTLNSILRSGFDAWVPYCRSGNAFFMRARATRALKGHGGR
jgi:hypothetical protein